MSEKRYFDWCDGLGLLLAALFFASWFLTGTSTAVPWLSIVTIAFGTAVAVPTDLRSRIIPNWLTYGCCLATIALSAITEMLGRCGWDSRWLCISLGESLAGAVVCLSAMLILYLFADTGGGDVKLATAWGACLGASSGLMLIAMCYLIAGTFAMAVSGAYWLRHRDVRGTRLPMAPFFAMAAIFFSLGFNLW